MASHPARHDDPSIHGSRRPGAAARAHGGHAPRLSLPGPGASHETPVDPFPLPGDPAPAHDPGSEPWPVKNSLRGQAPP